jgi:multidrug efflux system outer membrane protein
MAGKTKKIAWLFLFLGSCNLSPRYERPDMNLSKEWRFPLEDLEGYANVAWWEAFEDPILTDLIKTALQNNQDLQVAIARVLQFYDQYRVAFSHLLPEVNGQAQGDRIKSSYALTPTPPPTSAGRITSLYQLLLNFSYEFDFWGKIRNQAASAWADYLGQVDAQRNVVVALVSNVAKGYVQLKEFDNQLMVAQKTWESRKAAWDYQLKRFRVGLVSEMEVKQAESDAESAAAQIINFKTFIAQQEDLISVLLGKEPGPIPRGVLLDEMKLPPKVPAGLPSDLLENRPDILQAEQKIISANAQIGAARAAFFPDFTFTGTTGKRSITTRNLFNSLADSFDYSLEAIQPLFEGGRLIYQLKEEEAILQEAVHLYQQTILTALQEVDDALISYENTQEKLEVKTRQVEALARYFKLANLRYENGQNDYLTVLSAENSFFQAQLEKVATQADIFNSLIDLYKALGQGWQVDGDYVNTAKCL